MKLLVFKAVWCGPCRIIKKIIDAYIEQHPEVKDRIEFLDVDDERNRDLAVHYGAMSIPTMLLMKDEDENQIIIERHVGQMSPAQFAEFVRPL